MSLRDKLPPQDVKAGQVVSAKVQGSLLPRIAARRCYFKMREAALDKEDESRSKMIRAALRWEKPLVTLKP